MIKIAIIIGSTRPGRNGEAVIGSFDAYVFVLLSLFTDFENFSIFKPGPQQEASANAMVDQLIAWGGAVKMLRKTSASIK
jgi:NAD(P)H-dependent FMN reductase